MAKSKDPMLRTPPPTKGHIGALAVIVVVFVLLWLAGRNLGAS